LLRQEIEKVTLDDVQKYHEELMCKGTAVATITGPLSKLKGLKKKVLKELSGINHTFSKDKIRDKAFDLPKTSQVVVQTEKGRIQSDIVQLFHIDIKEIKNIASMSLLDSILGSGGFNSRLFKDLREKQKLAYNAGSRFYNRSSYAQQSLTIKTGIVDAEGNLTDNIEKSILGFEKHIKAIIKNPPSEEEVKVAKKCLFNLYTMWAADAEGQNDLLSMGVASKYGAQYFNKLAKAIETVTPQDVQEAAKKYLTKPTVTSILTTKAAAKKSAKS